MKITAKGIFKRLGYKKEIMQVERLVTYKKPDGTGFSYIQFDLKDKVYESYSINSRGKQEQIITPKEMLAIFKQMEELGWI